AGLGLTLKVTSGFLYPIAVAVSALTTLTTPYLIRSADGLVSRFDRWAPCSLVNWLGLYTSWVGQWGNRPINHGAKFIRRWIFQMLLNAVLIAGVFIATAYVGQHPFEWLKGLGLNDTWLKSLLWLAAMTLSLPMFIATSRKLQALGLLVAELKVSEAAAGARTAAIRALVAQMIAIAGTVILGTFVILLSATLLPTYKVFLILLVLVGLISWLLRRSFIRVYSKAQVALEETLAEQPHSPVEPVAAAPLPGGLRQANLQSVTLPTSAKVAGKRLREIQLRSVCGASIVGIDREGLSVINPGPEEELRAGDHVLLLGTAEQLAAADKLLQAT
ncbi:MAG TPA: TrkA C-terminal domain-containing protein, partial [Verrucomicrobiae bacterium]